MAAAPPLGVAERKSAVLNRSVRSLALPSTGHRVGSVSPGPHAIKKHAHADFRVRAANRGTDARGPSGLRVLPRRPLSTRPGVHDLPEKSRQALLVEG